MNEHWRVPDFPKKPPFPSKLIPTGEYVGKIVQAYEGMSLHGLRYAKFVFEVYVPNEDLERLVYYTIAPTASPIARDLYLLWFPPDPADLPKCVGWTFKIRIFPQQAPRSWYNDVYIIERLS